MGKDSVKDSKKVKRLQLVALTCLSIRMLIYLLPWNIKGFLIEILWIPVFFYVLALFFNGFEKILNLIVSKKKN